MSERAGLPLADDTWDAEEAGPRFEEIMRRARASGPQYVLRAGQKAVAVVDAAELDRLRSGCAKPLVPFLESLHAGSLDLTRESTRERDVEL